MKVKYIPVMLTFFLLTACSATNKGQLKADDAAVDTKPIGHNIEAGLSKGNTEAVLDYIVNKKMDSYDRQQLNHVYERGVSGQTAAWLNPDQGNQYQVTPQPAYNDSKKKRCRKAEIVATSLMSDKSEKTYTTACRDQNGHWQLQ